MLLPSKYSIVDYDELANEEHLRKLPKSDQELIQQMNDPQSEYYQQLNSEQRLKVIYNVRGRHMNELENKLACVQEDHARQMRAMTHEKDMCVKQLEETTRQLELANERVHSMRAELDKQIAAQHEQAHKMEQVKKTNRELEASVKTCQMEIESLQAQINDHHESDSVEKMRESYEGMVQEWRDKYERDMQQMGDQVRALHADLDERSRTLAETRERLAEVTHNFEKAHDELGLTCSRLTKRLTDSET